MIIGSLSRRGQRKSTDGSADYSDEKSVHREQRRDRRLASRRRDVIILLQRRPPPPPALLLFRFFSCTLHPLPTPPIPCPLATPYHSILAERSVTGFLPTAIICRIYRPSVCSNSPRQVDHGEISAFRARSRFIVSSRSFGPAVTSGGRTTLCLDSACALNYRCRRYLHLLSVSFDE